jgi:hypothetical protein
MCHFGFIRPESVRRWRRRLFFEPSTEAPLASRVKTTQCQNGRFFSTRHLMSLSGMVEIPHLQAK